MNYWEYKEYSRCDHSTRTHHYIQFRLNRRSRARLNTIILSFYQDESCIQALAVYAYTTGNDLDILEMSILAEEARKAWGTTSPSMQNLRLTREIRDKYAAQLNGRASRTHSYTHFSCIDLSCK